MQRRSDVKRGEVWWVEQPDQKRRPYVVLSRDAVIGLLSEVIVVPVTTTIRNLPTEVPLGLADGLSRPSVANFDTITAMARGYLIEHLTTLTEARMLEVCAALRIAVDC